jgi:hypothetical protein
LSRTAKVLVIAIALAVVVAASSFSLGLGLAYGLDPVGGLPQNVMFSAKFDQVPFLLGVGASFQEPIRIGVTADWWMATGNLVSFINYYIGPGVYAGIGNGNFDIGLRIPVGINAYPIPELELFLEIAPAIGFLPTFPSVGVQGAIGFRFWF